MPVQRVSKSFKDISMSFMVNPITYDLATIKNETAIARSIRNIVLTNPGERFFEPDFGSNVSRTLFETLDDITASSLKDEIDSAITAYEPRVELNTVDVVPDYDNSQFNVTVNYTIVGTEAQPQQLSFALEPTR